ncbi:hypothetical protein JY651_29135 [Pyxidicoccus parkwayensis]|jgi:hypothetical protein|uniref:YggT family protein n=1 Tax=Pyxidicoccus parkwayensis TaxID=2813578 RepID=A0ABX7PCT9_9BACT|nr:hypothetical protein [Pyxidicoccus parkwaysis]QSQ28301.1 hypothetical protein JY651_29135 [Pyxidicoccus parkwaysis]
MWGNAFLLSLLYLVLGFGVELALRVYPTRFLQRLSLSLDSLPARALELVGAMDPLREAYFSGRVTEFGVRIIFGVTTVLVIFLLALVVGSIMGGLRLFVARRAWRRAGGR